MILWLGILSLLLASLVVFLLFSSRSNDDSGKKPKYFWGVLGCTTILSVFVYMQLGAADELVFRNKMAALSDAAAANPESSLEQAMELVRELENATKTNPDKAEYWYLLATQQVSLERYQDAAASYGKAYELLPADVSLLARQTEAEYIASEYRLTESVQTLIDQVLEKEPNNSVVMGILGITAYRGQRFDMAIQFWERALSNMPADSTDAETMRLSIAQARANIGVGSGEVKAAVENQESIAEIQDEAEGEGFVVDVSLGDGLAFPPETAVFVFIRQAGGPPMPIVVERTAVSALPAKFVMDDSKVMIQGQSLANFPSLEIVARVSLTGQPTAQPGDYQAVIGPLVASEISEAIALVIADKVP